jgi:integrase
VAELHRHKAAQLDERMLAGSERHDEDLVLAQPNGRPSDKKTDYDDWTRLLQQSGVRDVRLHEGRHTAATLLLSERWNRRSGRLLGTTDTGERALMAFSLHGPVNQRHGSTRLRAR